MSGKAGKYNYLYKMDTDIAYNWLQVQVNANHPSVQNCIIDTSDIVCDGLNHITDKIIEEAITTTDPDIIGISSVLDAKDEENSEGMYKRRLPKRITFAVVTFVVQSRVFF